MNSDRVPIEDEPKKVRSSRYMGLLPTIALGSSMTVALGVFVLLGVILDIAGTRVALSYGLAALIFIPVVLAYAERALALPYGKGLFSLGREGDPSFYVYTSKWLALGGLALLVGLLSWGIAYHLNLLLNRFFSFSIDLRFLTIAIVVLVVLLRSISDFGAWQTRVRLVYLSVPILLIVIGLGWYSLGGITVARFVSRSPGDTVTAIAVLGGLLWGLTLIIEQRDRMRNQSRNLFLSLYVALAIGCLSGLVAALVVLDSPNVFPGDRVPLAFVTASAGGWVEVIYLIFGMVICIIAVDRAIVSKLRLIGSMMQVGFIPSRIQLFNSRFSFNVGRVFVIAILSIFPLLFLSIEDTAALVASSVLVITGIIFGIDLLRPRLVLPKRRRFKLPFYPLFPALAVAVSIYFCLSFSLSNWVILGGWIVFGGLYYLMYARRHGLEIRRRKSVMVEETVIDSEKAYHILVDVTDTPDARSLIRVAIQLALARDGNVIVLQIDHQPTHIPYEMAKHQAELELEPLKEILQEISHEAVPIEPMVRIAPSRSSGIVETVREENIDLVLVGWKTSRRMGKGTLDSELNNVVNSAPCDVAVLYGEVTRPVSSVIVSTRGGPHAGKALKYGEWLTGGRGEKVVALNIVSGSLTTDKENIAKTQLEQAIIAAGHSSRYLTRVAQANNVKQGILDESAGMDLLLMGASTKGLLDEAVFDGIPVEVAQERFAPTLLVKHYEGAGQFWMRRLWQIIYSPLPTLTVAERGEVIKGARRSAQAGVDFYTLIILAAVIAFLGLVQNSAAVIIGAMLVAPLMSPILSMALSLVLGDGKLIAQSGDSTIKGVLMAIAVAVFVAVILPEQPITGEIIARTQPNLLDLMVALASGGAAAYALARKRLAAALPGVAIAAALVPPLSVVGYGLGYGLYSLAGGALLLFLTNLSAIILSAAIVFLLLGFRPLRSEYGQRIQRWILLTIGILLVIAIPLVTTTINLRNRLDRQAKVEDVLGELVEAEFAEVEDVVIQPRGDGFMISGTVYAYGDVTDEELKIIQTELSKAINAPVIIRVRVIESRLKVFAGSEGVNQTNWLTSGVELTPLK